MRALLFELLHSIWYTFILLRIYESTPAALKPLFVSYVGRIVYQRKHTLGLDEVTAMTGYGAGIFMNEICSLLLLMLLMLLLLLLLLR